MALQKKYVPRDVRRELAAVKKHIRRQRREHNQREAEYTTNDHLAGFRAGQASALRVMCHYLRLTAKEHRTMAALNQMEA